MTFTSCAQAWDYLMDPASDPRWIPAATNYWNTHCGGEGGMWPESGGTPPPRPK